MKIRKISAVVAVFSLVFAAAALLPAWEAPLRIRGNDGDVYERPGVFISSVGEVYVIFQVRTTGMASYIELFKYNGETVTKLKKLSEESGPLQSTYFPNVAVSENGEIHAVWAEYTKGSQGTQYIKYRFFDGSSWQPAVLLTTIINSDFCEDIRIACDNNKNAFIVLYDSTNGRCHFITKYFGQAATDSFPVDGRSKHADIACDSDYVYLTWQHWITTDYGIFYKKRENKANGAWGPTIDLKSVGTQRPCIALDKDSKPHITYWRDYGQTRELFYRKGGEENLTNTAMTTKLSVGEPRSYHFADFSIRGDSMFATWQLGYDRGGQAIYYNWYKDGAWSGPTALPGVSFPALTVSALSPDGSNAVVVYPSNDTAVWLISYEQVTPGNPPTPVITTDRNELFWGGSDTIKFDASGSTPAAGATITKYEWDFAGTRKEGAQATYTYEDIKQYGVVKVKLTVTDDKKARASLQKEIVVNALYTPVVTSLREVFIRTAVFNRMGMEIQWQANSLNGSSAISGYQVFRRDIASADDFVKIGDAKEGAMYFLDATRLQGHEYAYGVAAVDDQGRISPLDHFAASTPARVPSAEKADPQYRVQ